MHSLVLCGLHCKEQLIFEGAVLVYNTAATPLGGVVNKTKCSNAVRSIIESTYEVHIHSHCHTAQCYGHVLPES